MTTEQDINDFTTTGGINIRRTTAPEIYEGARMLLVATRRRKFRQAAARRVCGR